MRIPIRIVRVLGTALTAAAVGAVATSSLQRSSPTGPAHGPVAVVLPSSVRASMNREFIRNNEHWDELTEMNTLEQMLGSAGPTQREYLGCLQGLVDGHIVRVSGWSEARGLRQLQYGVTGDCEGVPDRVGTWHTHPYRADTSNRPLRQRGLSPIDLETFAAGDDPVTLVVWDVDSIEAAVRLADGAILHPARVLAE